MADTEEDGSALERRGETGITAIAETTTEVRRVTQTVRRTVRAGGATATAVARLTTEARTTERGQTASATVVAMAVAPPLPGSEPLVARAEATPLPLRP